MKRLPLLEEKNSKKITFQKCKIIGRSLISYYSDEKAIGLMNGLTGISLFFFHFYRLSGEKEYKYHGYSALEKSIKEVEKGINDPSFSSGISGLLWTLHYLGSKDFIDKDEAKTLDGLFPMFKTYIINQLEAGNYDFLHGSLGTFFSLFDTPDEEETKHIDPEIIELSNLLVREISMLSKKDTDHSIYWANNIPGEDVKEINLGLAHGMPSILLVLSMIFKSFNNPDILENLIEPGMRFLIKYKNEIADPSLFPTRIVNQHAHRPSRLAWCYGDPGIGQAIIQIGENCSRPDWVQLGLSVLESSSPRKNFADTKIHDACICHGSAGLAMIYYQAAQKMNNELLLSTANHWLKYTLDYHRNDIVPTGFLFHAEKNEYLQKYSLLEGIAGVGLSLLSILEGDSTGWEKGLLIL